MAEETRHTHRPLTIMHEVEDGIYRMTVHNSKTGEMQFTMTMPTEDALDVADTMTRMLHQHYEETGWPKA